MTPSPFSSEKLLFTPATPDPDAIDLVFAFPNDYNVGITSLGYQVVWATFAVRSDVSVSRLFMDVSDALPSQPEILGFSVSWELDYVNILGMLEKLSIPIWSGDRPLEPADRHQ